MLQSAQDPDSRPLSRREVRARQANTTWGRALRYVGLIVGIYLGWNLGLTFAGDDPGADGYGYPIIVSASLGALFFILTPYLTIGVLSWLRQEVRRIEASDLIAAAAGLLVGGLVSTLIAFPLAMLPNPFGQFVPVVALLLICSVAVLSALTKKRELMDLIGFRRTSSDTSPAGAATHVEQPPAADEAVAVVPARPRLLLDTSAIIDGRVHRLSAGGFLPYEIIVPHFVLHELQLIADSDDYTRRSRGQRGLETLEEMRIDPEVVIKVKQIDADGPDVDSQLVSVAGTLDIPILSGDSNLERVANLQSVRFLNLHNLAELMRPALAVGDKIELKIAQKGREYQQGVGFLDDGTMVVVDAGEPHIDEEVTVVITRTLQTSSGRMMFARLDSQEMSSQ